MNFDALIIDQPVYGSLMVLADLFLKGLLILVGARLLTAFLSKSAAAARHLIWATALVMILLLPVFSVVLPKLTVPLLKQPFQASSTVEGATSVLPGLSERQNGLVIDADRYASATPLDIAEGQVTSSAALDAREPAALPAPMARQGIASDEVIKFWAPFADFLSKAHWTTIVIGLWSLGALAVLFWTLIGICGAWWITRGARSPESEDWADLNEELADRLLVYRPVKLLMSSSISSPMTWGVWRPVILLPIDADDWSEDRRRYVLLHEMSHIKRWDTLTQFAAQLSCALHWFNPLAWRGLHRMRIEQEKACDDLVLSHDGMKASEYARHLLEIARSLKMPWVSPLNTISMAKPSQLEGRVVDILDPSRKKRTINRIGGVLTCALALSVMLPISAFSPWEQASEVLPGIAFEEPEEKQQRRAALAIETDTETETETGRQREGLRIARLPRATTETRASGLVTWEENERVAKADTSEKQRRARKVAINALRASLDDENAEVRRHAAITLAEMDDEGSVDALIKLLQTDMNAEVRRTAIMALSELESDKAIDAFLIAVNDRNSEVRQVAVRALSDMDDQRAVAALISVLDDENANVRRHAVIGVTEHGTEDMSRVLLKMLDDKNSDVRRHVLMGLAERRNPEALPAIMKALDDKNAEVRRYAVIALGEYDDPGTTLVLRKALKDANSEVRQHAMMVLADHADEESMPLFIDLLLNDKNSDVRKHAAMALGEIGDIEAVDALTSALSDKNSEVRRFATMALSELDYGDDAWEDDADDDEWGALRYNESDWENAEQFGEAMAEIGVSASKFGLAIGEMSLNLTSDVLAELSYSLDNLEFDSEELASIKEELYMSEVELQEHMFELESLQFELEKDWNEESFEAILEMFEELEPVFNASPVLCERAVSIFDEKEEKVRARALKKLECRSDAKPRN